MGGKGIIFWIVILAIIVGSHIYHYKSEKLTEPTEDQLVSVSPTAVKATHEKSPIDHYKLYDSDGNLVGAAFLTARLPPKVRGYGGEINCLVGVTPEGELTGVKIISHKETPQYIQLLEAEGFLKAFEGKRVQDGLHGIDAVTTATISSGAIVKDVKSSASLVANELFRIFTPTVAGEEWFKKWFSWPALFTLAVVILSIAAFMTNSKLMRWLTFGSSLVVIGFLLNVPLTIGNLTNAVVGEFPTASNIPLIIIIIFAVASALLKGPIYCSYVCPFGALQEGTAVLLKKKLEPDIVSRLDAGRLRYLILFVFVVLFVVLDIPGSEQIEPFSSCFSKTAEAVVMYQVAVILLISIFIRRVWCRYFCPTGLGLDAICNIGVKIRRVIRGKKEEIK